MREIEILQEKVAALRDIEPYIGRFFSENYVNKHILGFSDEQVEQMKREIKENPSPNPMGMDSLGNTESPNLNTMDSESHITTPTSDINELSKI